MTPHRTSRPESHFSVPDFESQTDRPPALPAENTSFSELLHDREKAKDSSEATPLQVRDDRGLQAKKELVRKKVPAAGFRWSKPSNQTNISKELQRNPSGRAKGKEKDKPAPDSPPHDTFQRNDWIDRRELNDRLPLLDPSPSTDGYERFDGGAATIAASVSISASGPVSQTAPGKPSSTRVGPGSAMQASGAPAGPLPDAPSSDSEPIPPVSTDAMNEVEGNSAQAATPHSQANSDEALEQMDASIEEPAMAESLISEASSLLPPIPPELPVTGQIPGATVTGPDGTGKETGQETISPDGIPGAQSGESMKKSVAKYKVDPAGRQKVPGEELIESKPTDKVQLDPVHADRAGVKDESRTENGPQAVSWTPFGTNSGVDRSGTEYITPTSGAARTSSEHVLLEISKHAVECRQFKADSLAVVLKPDPDTEIFLRLKFREGVVDVYARLDRGAGDLLKSHWAEMQKSLQQQSIRLSPLADSIFPNHAPSSGAGSSSDSWSNSGNSHRPSPDTTEPKPSIRIPKLVDRSGTIEADMDAGHWQTWA